MNNSHTKKNRSRTMFAQEFLRVCDKETSQILLETQWCPLKTSVSEKLVFIISHLDVLIISVNVLHIQYISLTFYL